MNKTKYILTSLCVLFMISAFFMGAGFKPVTTTIITAPTPFIPVVFHDSTNPYCNGLIPSPPDPTPCPEGKYLDVLCVSWCETSYNDSVNSAYAAACASYDDAAVTYNGCTTTAGNAYTACLLAAHNAAERTVCKNTYFAAMQTCANTFTASANTIATTLSNAQQAAETAFIGCAWGCCIDNN
jgi:hypothetical protein